MRDTFGPDWESMGNQHAIDKMPQKMSYDDRVKAQAMKDTFGPNWESMG
jgi:hypothetical protein